MESTYITKTAKKLIIGQKICKFLAAVSICACIGTNLASAKESIVRSLVKKDGKPDVGFKVKVTWYCSCRICTGKDTAHPSYGITASGVKAKAGTIAVDRRLIPLGSKVWVEGIGVCTADDVGGKIKGRRLDVWVSSHSEAIKRGVSYRKVKILKSGSRKQKGG